MICRGLNPLLHFALNVCTHSHMFWQMVISNVDTVVTKTILYLSS